MIFWAIIFGIALAFFIAFSLYLSSEDDADFNIGLVCGVFIILLSVAEIITIIDISSNFKPKAIDVYRGKTVLKISYVDTIPQDTVVVWKNIGGVK